MLEPLSRPLAPSAHESHSVPSPGNRVLRSPVSPTLQSPHCPNAFARAEICVFWFQYTQRMDPKPSAVNELNGPPSAGIPGLSKRRLALLAGAAAVIGIAVAVVVWLTTGSSSKPVAEGGPAEWIATGAGEASREGNARPAGSRGSGQGRARSASPAGDVRVRVAELLATDTMARRQQTIAALRKLPQDALPVGLALGDRPVLGRDVKPAVTSLERVKHADMYGFYGTEADNLLNFKEAPRIPELHAAATRSPKGSLASASRGGQAAPHRLQLRG